MRPWPVKRGGWVLTAVRAQPGRGVLRVVPRLLGCCTPSGGAKAYSEEELAHGGEPVGIAEYITTSQFWFESFQNWQSEFLAVAAIVGFSVYLRQRGSAESKPVAEPHFHTGAS